VQYVIQCIGKKLATSYCLNWISFVINLVWHFVLMDIVVRILLVSVWVFGKSVWSFGLHCVWN